LMGCSQRSPSYKAGMKNLPSHFVRHLQKVMCRPEGTVDIKYTCPDLFDKEKSGGIIFEIPSGEHLFRLERDNALCINFYHFSPGTGTRVATIDLNNLPPVPSVYLAFEWTPDGIKLYVGAGSKFVSATGIVSKKQFRIGKDGHVYKIGDHGVEVKGLTFYQAGQPIITPTAKEAWGEILHAIDILATGQSTKGYAYEIVLTNLTISILVTGFEAYMKKRFLEIEKEGIAPDTDAIIKAFYPKEEREKGIDASLESEAKTANVSVLQYIVNRNTINFQNYKDCKRAYNKGYGIKFGHIGLSSKKLEALQSYIGYRHKIIHISPSLGVLNKERVPPDEPVFPKKETAQMAKDCFEEFIKLHHKGTLALRPKT